MAQEIRQCFTRLVALNCTVISELFLHLVGMVEGPEGCKLCGEHGNNGATQAMLSGLL